MASPRKRFGKRALGRTPRPKGEGPAAGKRK
jgi:hypothetical protein